MKGIVFVGQTPPPFGGQAIMIEKILKGNYNGIRLFHVRMNFSKEMNEIGKPSASKIIHLFNVIAKIYYLRIIKRASTLYYPPAGPDRVPVIRDIVILATTRWLFKKTIFHFHAGGVSEMKIDSRLMAFFFKLAYYNADCAILLSELNPPDGKNLKSKKTVIAPYGIEDNNSVPKLKAYTAPVKILFVAIIKESKGILVLLEAAKQLKAKGLDFSVEVMGKFESIEFQEKVKRIVKESDLEDRLSFLGVLSGESKWSVFKNADIFCFPTFFESETFGVVLLEAMQFSLPIISTKWRGIPSIVEEGRNGFLVEPKKADALADKMEVLISNQGLRQQMGELGREIFLKKYSLAEFQIKMEQIFKAI